MASESKTIRKHEGKQGVFKSRTEKTKKKGLTPKDKTHLEICSGSLVFEDA